MHMTRGDMFLGFICLFAIFAPGQGRTLTQTFPAPPPQSGVTVPITQINAPVNLTVFSITGNNQCVIQGYPGSRGDSTVPGPLTFSLDPSITAIRTYYATSGGGAIVVYNNTMDVVVANSSATGLTQADYYKDSTPTSHGSLSGGLIPNFFGDGSPTDPPACYMTVNFVTAQSG